MKVTWLQHAAWIRRPPQQRLVLVVPGENAVSIGVKNAFNAEIAAGGQQGYDFEGAPPIQLATSRPLTPDATVAEAAGKMAEDFTPLTDMRASARYRMEAACNMLRRYHLDLSGAAVDVRGVRP